MQSALKRESDSESHMDANAGATPLVAAAFLSGIVYLWVEACFRLLFTYTSLASVYVLWQARVGDIAAMWLTMWVVSAMVFFVFGYLVFRGRVHVGSIWFWTILLIVSAIVAPLLGEIGTPIGI